MKLDGPSIDLVRVATLAGNAHAVKTGLLAVKGDITLRRDGASGQMHAEIDRLSTEEVNGGKVVLDLQVEGRKVDLAMTAELGQAGTLEIATRRLVVDGSPSDPASWKRAHGAAKFSANLDAAKIATLVPKESLPFSELRGQIVIEGAVRRDSANVPPELSVHAHTRGLVVAGKAPPERDLDSVHGKKVSGVQPWRSEGIDASFDARVDAASGLGEVAFHSVDKKGTLVGFDAKSILPYEQLLKEPDHAVALLQKTPVTAKLVVPKRALSDFPDFSGLRNLLGTVELEIDVAGTSLEPHFALVAHARDVGSPSLSAKLASDADVTVHYDGKQARLLGNLKSGKKPSLEIDAQLDVLAKDLVSPTPGQDLPWGGSGHVKLARFPLQSVNVLADRRIRGHVSGEATVVDLHKAAQLDAHLAFEDLKMGRAAYKSGNIVVIAKDGKLSAGARLEQTDGFADIQAAIGLSWGDKLVPAIDPNADLQAHLEAKGFRAAALLPFVSAQLNELDGRIDANTTVKIGPGFTNPTLEGNIDFHDGTLQLAAVGEEYKKAKAKFLFQPGGIIKVEDIYLQGTEGQLSGEGLVKTRGLGFEYAKANVVIPKKRPLDLAVRGQGLGAVSGNVSIVATNSADGKNMKVEVDVPTLALVLPQKIKSGVQELSPKEDIRVGVFRDPKNFVKLPLDKQDLEPPAGEKPVGTIIDVDVKLGEATVTQGTMAKIVLTGTPHIKITNTTEVSGQISVKEGQIDVQGKKFEIVKGTITFQPQDTSNPVVVAQATWTAEDGTHVYADFVGPVKTGKVTLSSDTGLKPSEVLAVILFGTADGVSGAPKSTASTTGGQKAAVGAGGGFATQGLTEAMDDLTGIQATAKIDTTRSANPAPEIEVQIAKGVSLAFEHVLGTPPITQPDTNLATVDWRFRSNWSLETTFGDRGLLQTDAVWQKRY